MPTSTLEKVEEAPKTLTSEKPENTQTENFNSFETTIMPPQSMIVDSIKTKILGHIGSQPDLKIMFHSYPFGVDFFELASKQKRKICIGFMLSPYSSTEAQIIIIHNSMRNLRNDLLGDAVINHSYTINKIEQLGVKKIKPEVTIIFQYKEKTGTIQALAGGEGSRRINLAKFDPGFEELFKGLQNEISSTVRAYNLSAIKSLKKAKQKK